MSFQPYRTKSETVLACQAADYRMNVTGFISDAYRKLRDTDWIIRWPGGSEGLLSDEKFQKQFVPLPADPSRAERLGRIAYEAALKTFDRERPSWDDLNPTLCTRWTAAALAVADAVTQDDARTTQADAAKTEESSVSTTQNGAKSDAKAGPGEATKRVLKAIASVNVFVSGDFVVNDLMEVVDFKDVAAALRECGMEVE